MKVMSEHYKGSDSLLSRIDDWVLRAEKGYSAVATPFLNESEIETVKKYCGNKVLFSIDGGSPYAKRAKVIFHGQTPWESDIVCLVAKIRRGSDPLEHRDVLGALMNLNIDRNQFGDCWVDEDKVVVYTSKHLSISIQQDCTKIRRTNVHFEESEERYVQPLQKESHAGFVSSERIDSIVGCMINKSRADAQSLIESQRVQVNHQIVNKQTKICNVGDVISIRGSGRFIYKGVSKLSKKNRMLIEYERYVG